MKCLDVISFNATSNNCKPLGSTFRVRRFDVSKKCFITAIVSNQINLDPLKSLLIQSPTLNSLGKLSFPSYNKQNITGDNDIFPDLLLSQVKSEETLIVNQLDGNGSIFLYYEDIPNISQQFISCNDLAVRAKRFTPVSMFVNVKSTAYSTPVSILSSQFIGTFDASKKYALVGGYSSLNISVCKISSPENSLAIPFIPANSFSNSPNYFVRLSKKYGLDLVPVFDFKHLDAIQISCLLDVGDVSYSPTPLTLNFVELA